MMAGAGIHHGFSTGGNTILPAERATVLFDGIFSSPRLQHPEGVAAGPDGWVWAGSENGQILRIAPDGSAIEEVASTDGFLLGLAFDGDRALFACDSRHRAVFRLNLADRSLRRFTAGHRGAELRGRRSRAWPSLRFRYARPGRSRSVDLVV